jgi:hypothetical protein
MCLSRFLIHASVVAKFTRRSRQHRHHVNLLDAGAGKEDSGGANDEEAGGAFGSIGRFELTFLSPTSGPRLSSPSARQVSRN